MTPPRRHVSPVPAGASAGGYANGNIGESSANGSLESDPIESIYEALADDNEGVAYGLVTEMLMDKPNDDELRALEIACLLRMNEHSEVESKLKAMQAGRSSPIVGQGYSVLTRALRQFGYFKELLRYWWLGKKIEAPDIATDFQFVGYHLMANCFGSLRKRFDTLRDAQKDALRLASRRRNVVVLQLVAATLSVWSFALGSQHGTPNSIYLARLMLEKVESQLALAMEDPILSEGGGLPISNFEDAMNDRIHKRECLKLRIGILLMSQMDPTVTLIENRGLMVSSEEFSLLLLAVAIKRPERFEGESDPPSHIVAALREAAGLEPTFEHRLPNLRLVQLLVEVTEDAPGFLPALLDDALGLMGAPPPELPADLLGELRPRKLRPGLRRICSEILRAMMRLGRPWQRAIAVTVLSRAEFAPWISRLVVCLANERCFMADMKFILSHYDTLPQRSLRHILPVATAEAVWCCRTVEELTEVVQLRLTMERMMFATDEEPPTEDTVGVFTAAVSERQRTLLGDDPPTSRPWLALTAAVSSIKVIEALRILGSASVLWRMDGKSIEEVEKCLSHLYGLDTDRDTTPLQLSVLLLARIGALDLAYTTMEDLEVKSIQQFTFAWVLSKRAIELFRFDILKKLLPHRQRTVGAVVSLSWDGLQGGYAHQSYTSFDVIDALRCSPYDLWTEGEMRLREPSMRSFPDSVRKQWIVDAADALSQPCPLRPTAQDIRPFVALFTMHRCDNPPVHGKSIADITLEENGVILPKQRMPATEGPTIQEFEYLTEDLREVFLLIVCLHLCEGRQTIDDSDDYDVSDGGEKLAREILDQLTGRDEMWYPDFLEIIRAILDNNNRSCLELVERLPEILQLGVKEILAAYFPKADDTPAVLKAVAALSRIVRRLFVAAGILSGSLLSSGHAVPLIPQDIATFAVAEMKRVAGGLPVIGANGEARLESVIDEGVGISLQALAQIMTKCSRPRS